LFFHDNKGYANAPHTYVIHSLPVLLTLPQIMNSVSEETRYGLEKWSGFPTATPLTGPS